MDIWQLRDNFPISPYKKRCCLCSLESCQRGNFNEYPQDDFRENWRKLSFKYQISTLLSVSLEFVNNITKPYLITSEVCCSKFCALLLKTWCQHDIASHLELSIACQNRIVIYCDTEILYCDAYWISNWAVRKDTERDFLGTFTPV